MLISTFSLIISIVLMSSGEIYMPHNYQSHTFEPSIGDSVVNTNSNCKHHGSKGTVVDIVSLPDDSGKTICYQCTNDGPSWSRGDVLEKTMDQLSPMGQLESRIRRLVREILRRKK